MWRIWLLTVLGTLLGACNGDPQTIVIRDERTGEPQVVIENTSNSNSSSTSSSSSSSSASSSSASSGSGSSSSSDQDQDYDYDDGGDDSSNGNDGYGDSGGYQDGGTCGGSGGGTCDSGGDGYGGSCTGSGGGTCDSDGGESDVYGTCGSDGTPEGKYVTIWVTGVSYAVVKVDDTTWEGSLSDGEWIIKVVPPATYAHVWLKVAGFKIQGGYFNLWVNGKPYPDWPTSGKSAEHSFFGWKYFSQPSWVNVEIL